MVPLAIPALLILHTIKCIIYVQLCCFAHPVVFVIVCALCGYLPRVAAASRMRQDRQDRPCGCLPLFGKLPICGCFQYADSCRNAENKTEHAALVRIEFATLCGSLPLCGWLPQLNWIFMCFSVLLVRATFGIVFECSNWKVPAHRFWKWFLCNIL